MKYYISVICSLFLFIGGIFAQTTVKGKVTDKATGEGLIGVSVTIGDDFGAISEEEGAFELLLDDGEYVLTYTYVGYADFIDTISINGEPTIELNIILEESSQIIDIITVTGSRYEKNITQEAVSIEVITPEFITRNASTDLGAVIERVPGVQVIDGQANIRSGSGFAYAAGSRVAVVVDDQALLSAELSDIKWNFIPIENAQQIEIIKGAASVLYGSAGLNGVINVRTAYPTSEPYTKLSFYAGSYHISNKNNRRWYKGIKEQPFFSGLYFAHRKKLSPNFDLVLGANVHYDKSYLKSQDEYRFRFNFNTRYRPEKYDNISMGVNGNIMFHQRGDFFLWVDGADSTYYHIDDPINNIEYFTVTIDPWLTVFDNFENKHTAKFRVFSITKFISQTSPTALYSAEYQFQREFKQLNTVVTAGASYQRFWAKSNLFTKEVITTTVDTTTLYTSQTADVGAMFLQADKGFFNNRLNLTFGVRLERFQTSADVPRTFPVFRGGANFKLTDRDFLRTSFGQGYRIPSLAERYIDEDIIDGVAVLPNYELRPEIGYSTEIGYKRAIGKKDGWHGFIDFATFMMEYKDMTEFQFNLHCPDSIDCDPNNPLDIINSLQEGYLGFRGVNVSRARIAGFELSAFGEGAIGKIPTRVWMGYTYSYPGDLSRDPAQINAGTYIKNMFKAFAMQKGDPLGNSLLNYRALHVARMDVECDIDKFTVGMAANYNGYMHNVDDFFKGDSYLTEVVTNFSPELDQIVSTLDEYREAHAKGDWVLDARVSYTMDEKNKFDFMINNFLNREYGMRPLKMNAPLNLNVRYNRTF